jgi:putative peptide zinc metalloprotease protein
LQSTLPVEAPLTEATEAAPTEVRPTPEAPLRLSAGAELLGQYEDSGFREPRYLVRRGDGQIVQLSRLLYLVASCLDRGADVDETSRYVSEQLGREVTADNIVYLIDRKLRATGLVSTPGSGDTAVATRANPLLALKLRLPLVPERVHGRVTASLRPVFRPPVVLGVLGAVVAFDVWLGVAGRHSLASAMRDVIYGPRILLAVTALTIVMGAFHETGHATAARYGGATPGAMGAGIYLVWPVFYTDVTDSYRLDRRGRLRTDLGGIYFNLVFSLVMAGLYGATGQGLFLAMVVIAQVETLRQLLPFVRLDGYYIVADLAGVPNLFPYLKPALTSAARFRQGVPRHTARTRLLRALTRRSQAVLTVWACVTFPILVANVVAFVVLAPRIAGTAWGSSRLQARVLSAALERGDVVALLNGVVGLTTLALPIAGVVYIVARIGARVPELVGMAWQRNARVTGVTATVVGLLLAFQVGVVWPDTFTRFAGVGQPVPAAVHDRAVRVGVLVGSGAVFGLLDVAQPAPPATPVPVGPRPAPGTAPPSTDTTGPGSDTTARGPDTTAPVPTTTTSPTTTAPPTTTTAPTTTTTAPPTTTTTTGPCLTILPVC